LNSNAELAHTKTRTDRNNIRFSFDLARACSGYHFRVERFVLFSARIMALYPIGANSLGQHAQKLGLL